MKSTGNWDIWCDEDVAKKIKALPGVAHVYSGAFKNKYHVYLDPRYNRNQLAMEIGALVPYPEKHELIDWAPVLREAFFPKKPTTCDLPASRYVSRISEMGLGEHGWTFPSAMYRNDGKWYLNGVYFVCHSRDGDATLKVYRLSDGFAVKIPADIKTKWTRGDTRHPTIRPIPVVSIEEVPA